MQTTNTLGTRWDALRSAVRRAWGRGAALLRSRPARGLLLFALPVCTVWAADLASRPRRILSFSALDAAAYLAASLETLALWSSLLVLAAAPRGWSRHVAAAVSAMLAALLIGGQLYFYEQYGSYVNLEAAQFGAAVTANVLNQLRADALNFAWHVALPAASALLLIVVTRRLAPPRANLRRSAVLAAPVAMAAMLLLPCSHRHVQAATPDVLFVHAFGKLAAVRTGLSASTWRHPTARTPDYVPALRSEAPLSRSVLLLIDESVRFDVSCTAYSSDCDTMRETNAATATRVPLLQLRAVASTTAVSLAVLWSGLSPLEPLEVHERAPLLFDFARAAGFKTAFVSAQNLGFADGRAFFQDLALDRIAEARDLDASYDVDFGAPDKLASQRMAGFLHELGEPFFAVVQYGNVHFPYRVDASVAPFQPSTDSKAPNKNGEFFNRYRNAVALHDRAVAALIAAVRSADFGSRTIIVYTSDHGEAFREHHQLGHGLSIFDEEVHVPGWVDAPPATMTDSERAHLRQASTAFTWHLDVAPTLLDMLGLWDAPELRRHRARMPGTSLMRGVTREPVPISNCATVWGCPFRNWGLMHGPKKLEAREWDAAWHCFDVMQDPGENSDLGAEACGELPSRALQLFGSLPRDGK